MGELPSHRHTGLDIDGVYVFGWDSGTKAGFDFMKNTTQGDSTGNRITTGYTGSNSRHNNMPSYAAMYAYKRIAWPLWGNYLTAPWFPWMPMARKSARRIVVVHGAILLAQAGATVAYTTSRVKGWMWHTTKNIITYQLIILVICISVLRNPLWEKWQAMNI